MSSLFDIATSYSEGHRDVTPEQVAARLHQVRVIDVREPHEFTGELGHIIGAELVPLSSLAKAAQAWPKETEYVLVCRSGGRSRQAAAILARAGFVRVMNMMGGMLAWNDARLFIDRAG